jgi:hypothetical protein
LLKIAEAPLDFCHGIAAEEAFADHRLLEVLEALVDALETLPHLGAETGVLVQHVRAKAIVLLPHFTEQSEGLVFRFGRAGCPCEQR